MGTCVDWLMLDNQGWIPCTVILSLSSDVSVEIPQLMGLWLGQQSLPMCVDVQTKPISLLLGCAVPAQPWLTRLLHDGGFSVGVGWGRRILIAPCANKNRAKCVRNSSSWLPKTHGVRQEGPAGSATSSTGRSSHRRAAGAGWPRFYRSWETK